MNQNREISATDRLDRLERENRRYRRFGIVAAAIAVVIATAGAFRDAVPKEIKARSFVVVDEAGRERAIFEAGPEGRALMVFLGKDGKMKAALGEEKENAPSLILFNPKEIGTARFIIRDDGNPDLSLSDSTETVRVALEMNRDGVSGLRLYDEHGKNIGILAQDTRGHAVTPVLGLSNNDTKASISLGLNEKGSPSFTYRLGELWRGVWQVEPDGGSTLGVRGPDGKNGLNISIAPDGSPSLNMTDKDGKAIVQIPKP